MSSRSKAMLEMPAMCSTSRLNECLKEQQRRRRVRGDRQVVTENMHDVTAAHCDPLTAAMTRLGTSRKHPAQAFDLKDAPPG